MKVSRLVRVLGLGLTLAVGTAVLSLAGGCNCPKGGSCPKESAAACHKSCPGCAECKAGMSCAECPTCKAAAPMTK